MRARNPSRYGKGHSPSNGMFKDEERADLLNRAGDYLGSSGDVAVDQEKLNQSLGALILEQTETRFPFDTCIIIDTFRSPMKAERPLNVVFFKTDAGNEPVREWLKELPKDDRKIVGADILTVQYAWPVGKPLVDNLGDGIWEVRSRLANRVARTLFAVVDEEIVLLHGFIKKQQKTPQHELDLAKKRKRQYLQNYEQKNPSRK